MSVTENSFNIPPVGTIVKAIGILQGLASSILSSHLFRKIGSKWDICSDLTDSYNLWLACSNNADATIASAKWLAASCGIGGLITAVVIYGIGHIATQVDKNNTLLLNLNSKFL